jgi:sec-independent protein translocase protein TatA
MLPNVGPGELIVVLVIALLVLGPAKLPEAGKSIGKGLREFKDAIAGKTDEEDQIGRHPHDPPVKRS